MDITILSMIADRGVSIAAEQGVTISKTTALMDIDSANEDCPMDLEKFYNFDDGNFGHDFFGIYRHMDRSEYPGKLTGCFIPRCAKKQ